MSDSYMRGLAWGSDKALAISVIALWSLGRLVNPMLDEFERRGASPGPVVVSLVILYVCFHIGVLIYSLLLAHRSFTRHGFRMHGRVLGEFLLYAYIIVTTLLSLYFLAYQLSFLPSFLENAVPYPLNIS